MKVLKESQQTIYVWRNIQLVRGRLILFTALFIFALVLFTLNFFIYSSIGLVIIPIAYVLGGYTYRSYLIWRSGSEGEKIVTKYLHSLPDNFILINGLVVPPNRGDIDNIILGPNGIFIIESKNYGGIIFCDGDNWKKERKYAEGVIHSVKVGSPSNQVKRNAKVLKDYILEHQDQVFKRPTPHIWVNSIIIFTNPKVELELNNPTVEIVDLEDIVSYIQNTKSEYSLQTDEVERLGRLLMNIYA